MASATTIPPGKLTLGGARRKLPQAVWLILLALGLGLFDGLGARELVKTFGSGFGRSLGDFALILIPSFILAACLSRQALNGAPGVAAAIAPATAAGMICPDTAYAALASVAGEKKLSVAFGSLAGYRLLFPAGPLIVATGLGVDPGAALVAGVLLLVPVWFVGEAWSRYRCHASGRLPQPDQALPAASLLRALFPLLFLAALLAAGSLSGGVTLPLVEFVTRPKGALIVAAVIALLSLDASEWQACFESAMARSASLLMLIGAASAFGSMLTQTFPLERIIPASESGSMLLLVIFAVSMGCKAIYGSSTVTLAAAASVLAPLVQASGGSPVAAVLAVCLGSFLILPTDSFYWLVRSDALAHDGESASLFTLSAGALLQAGVGLLLLLLANLLAWV